MITICSIIIKIKLMYSTINVNNNYHNKCICNQIKMKNLTSLVLTFPSIMTAFIYLDLVCLFIEHTEDSLSNFCYKKLYLGNYLNIRRIILIYRLYKYCFLIVGHLFIIILNLRTS